MARVLPALERRHGGWIVDQEEDWAARRRYRRSYGAGRRTPAIRGEARKLKPAPTGRVVRLH